VSLPPTTIGMTPSVVADVAPLSPLDDTEKVGASGDLSANKGDARAPIPALAASEKIGADPDLSDEVPPDPEWLIEPEPHRPKVWSEQFRALVEVDADGREIPP
jgi:hypothetical protein